MEFEATETVRSTPSRHEKSLGLLTMKFVSLLQDAKDGVLDLKVVSETEESGGTVGRGIHGCSLTKKGRRSRTLVRGENSGSQSKEVLEQVNVLKAQISDLEAQEKELDNQKTWLEENIKHCNLDPITSTYPFVTSGI
ncbi:Transcription factor E2F5 [Liparis tanakae]|uniref:Transcription factor E2F5 n=1 Tax=Liparis tanakae TaxID=230148 RepID=A0A4Z2GQS4_9TELE|nr:Transcription factor E2F5 [Liparis tanakae]